MSFTRIRSLASASVILVLARICGAGASLVLTIVLARAMAPADLGYVFILMSAAFLTSIAATLNIESGSIRFLVAARENNRDAIARGFITFGRRVLLIIAPIVATLFLIGQATEQPQHSLTAIAFAAAAIPVIGWLRLTGAHGTALGQVKRSSLPRTAIQPVLFLLFTALLAAKHALITPASVMGAFFCAFFVTAVIQFLLLRPALRIGSEKNLDLTNWRDWALNGFFLAPVLLMQEYMQYAVIAAASIGLNASDVALLGVALRFIAFVRFGILAVNMVISPKVSRAIANHDDMARDRLLRDAALLKTAPAALAALFLVFFGGDLLAVLGAGYRDAGPALAWLSLIPLSAAILGPNLMLLNISGKRATIFVNALVIAGLLFITIHYAGLKFGLTGAACAAAITYAAWEAALYVAARRRLNIDASIFTVLRMNNTQAATAVAK